MNKEETYQELKKRIINEELTPGQWLVERDISEEFRISRTPVRAILRRLASDGLLELKPTKKRGTFVQKLPDAPFISVKDSMCCKYRPKMIKG